MAELRIVTYHSLDFGQRTRISRHAVAHDQFRMHLQAIVSKHRLITAQELNGMKSGADLHHLLRTSERHVYLMTFDDGYAEHLPAAEVLAEHGGAGVFFVSSGTPHGHTLLANKLHRLDLHAGGLSGAVSVIEAASGRPWRDHLIGRGRALLRQVRKATFDSPDDQAIKVAVQEEGHEEPLASAIDQALSSAGLASFDGVYASESALGSIVAAGSLIGGHGFTHRRIPLLAPQVQQLEIDASAALVKKFHPDGPLHFAHPYGTHSTESTAMLSKAGFMFQHSIEEGVGHELSDPAHLPRIDANRLHASL